MNISSFRSFLRVALLVCLVVSCAVAKKKDKESDEEAAARAARDLHTGMANLKDATQNPAMLAQLMKDLQVRSLIVVYYIGSLAVLVPCRPRE